MPLAIVWQLALAAVGVLVCGFLFVYGFIRPGRSRLREVQIDEKLRAVQRAAARAPGALGKWLQTPLRHSRTATKKSSRAGRRTRAKSR